ncbi:MULTISPECIES: hypothetical protein [unclassified Leptolyngbya]|uniref:hypothetical protein n=1 Tax=unclassified Leptolyngbya TaxID=2650499 RepID=UPI0016865CEA|nr:MULTISPECIES: hypothetical protein [unclassified Leptolyngbya]MBD1912387.1 hypothetical protein [Leptolyngbya sp. FACHB-8]MBD2157977.1 hypothetical protein [Leptolyngbya sp. FACHB-16]
MNALNFGGWIAIAITLVSGFSMAAEAQVSQQDTESTPIEVLQPVPEASVPASDEVTPPNSVVTSPDQPASSTVPLSPSISQVELPFSDVSPDHWAYEALLFLSTGSRQ